MRSSTVALFGVVYAPLALLGVVVGRDTFFGPAILELGDYAANALAIDRAEHLSEILGNYSRFGFHHPGPAFFYVYAAGDALFRGSLHVAQAPANAYMLAGLLLQLGFLAATMAILASLALANRVVFAVAASAIALVLLTITDSPQWQVWPPYQLVLPFACFLAAAIAVALGRAGLLPVLVLCGGFLVNGHVAQPLFVVPIALVGYMSLFLTMRERRPGAGVTRFMRETARPHVIAIAVAVPFVLPLVLDAARGPDSNLARIIAALGSGTSAPTWDRALVYVLELIALGGRQAAGMLDVAPDERSTFLASAWPLLAGWLAAALASAALILRRPPSAGPVAVVRGKPVSGRRFLATYYGILGLALGLTLVWAKAQQGGLYAFNAFFFNGLLLVAAVAPIFALARLASLPRWAAAGIIVVALGLLLVQPVPFRGVTTLGGAAGDDTAPELAAAAAKVTAQQPPPPRPILLRFQPDQWPMVVGLALDLQRQGMTYLVDPTWGFMFGDDHVYPGSPLIIGLPVPVVWNLATTGPIPLGPRLAIASMGQPGMP